MKRNISKLKKGAVSLIIAAFLLQSVKDAAYAAGPFVFNATTNLTNLASTPITLNNVQWIKWQFPDVALRAPTVVNCGVSVGVTCPIDFAYTTLNGANIPIPDRIHPNDNTANNQGDLWSMYGASVAFTPGNTLNQGVIIGTQNTFAGVNVGQGGLVGADGVSILPLLWKVISLNDLSTASNVSGKIASTNKVPYNPNSVPPIKNQVWMPYEVLNQTGGACGHTAADGPYQNAVDRANNNGFCDYSTHYMDDVNSTTYYSYLVTHGGTQAQIAAAFNYESVVGAYGVNTTEHGAGGGGKVSPALIIFGAGLANAIAEAYNTTIVVQAASH